MLRNWMVLGGALVGLLGACGSEDEGASEPPRPAVEVRDSAGVRVIVNHADTARLPLWTVDTVPVFQFGDDSDDIHHQFMQVESSILRSDGRVVVSDVLTQEVRLFDTDGSFLRLLGGPGEGPGEFRGIDDLALLPGDSVMVWDVLSARLTLFGPDGDLVRTTPVERPTMGYVPGAPMSLPDMRSIVRDPSGGFLSVLLGPMALGSMADTPTPVMRSIEVVRHDSGGGFLGTVVETPGNQRLHLPRGLPGAGVGRTHNSPTTWVALEDDRAHVAVSTRFEVRSYDADGRLLQRATYPRLERPFTREEWDRRRREIEERPPPPGATVSPERRAIVWDDRWRPAVHWPYAGIRTDAAGNIWLREGLVSARWLVLAPDGTARAVAHIGHGFHILDIGHDHILVKRRDALDVPIVKVLPLVRAVRDPPG